MPQENQEMEQHGEVFARAPQIIPDSPYLTPGKNYLVVEQYGAGFEIIDDVGDQIFCLWDSCCHLSCGDWERIA